MKIKLELTERQAKTLLRMLDFASRIPMGQTEELRHWTEADWDTCTALKRILFPSIEHPNAYYGIYDAEHVPDECRQAFDMIQCVRHAIVLAKWLLEDHKDDEVEYHYTVDWSTPIRTSTDEELPTVKVTGEDDDPIVCVSKRGIETKDEGEEKTDGKNDRNR